eukprot:6481059-Amphidinium_carterae.1
MSKVAGLYGARNSLTGTLPDDGLRALTILIALHLWENFISGTLPEGGLLTMLALIDLRLFSNCLEGSFPERTGFTALTAFYMQSNHFTGALPAHMLTCMKTLILFWISNNHFKGTLPKSGMRAMMAINNFLISENSFTGALPDGWIWKALDQFILSSNGFTGSIPEGIFVQPGGEWPKVYPAPAREQHLDIASSVQSCKPHVGAQPQLLGRLCMDVTKKSRNKPRRDFKNASSRDCLEWVRCMSKKASLVRFVFPRPCV